MTRHETLPAGTIQQIIGAIDVPEAAKTEERRREIKALFLILANLGCRLSEALALKWADIDWERSELTLTRLKQGKRNKGRRDTIPVDSGTIKALWELKEEKRSNSPRPFSLSRQGAYRAWQRLIKRAGVEEGTPTRIHALRHSAGTRFARKDLIFAMKMLGHSNINTTSMYLHHEKMRETFGEIEPIGVE